MANAYENDDYAGLTSKNLTAYYGYEETVGDEDDEEWCFVASVKGKEIMRVPQSKLGARDKFNCGENVLRGIGILLDKYELNLDV